jgi:hypothetical protein
MTHRANWPAVNPRKIVEECSPRHIQSVLEDAQATIARLTAERRELVEALRFISDLEGEINPSNYDHDDACNLNRAFCEAITTAADALAKVQP